MSAEKSKVLIQSPQREPQENIATMIDTGVKKQLFVGLAASQQVETERATIR